MKRLVLVLFSISTISTSEPICRNGRELVCEDIRDTFPENVDYDENKKLYCNNCNIKTFSSSTFPPGKDVILQLLNVSNSGIEVIEPAAFEKHIGLHHIYFENNKITSIPPNLFKGLVLYEVSFENNNFAKLSEGFVQNLKTNIFNLNHNNIVEIPNNVFKGITRLSHLKLSHNKIKIINYDAFEGLDINILDLDNNEICIIPLGIFKSLNSLSILNLANNKLTVMSEGVFSGLTNLKHLNLSYNFLESFDGQQLLPMWSLTNLNVEGNNFYDLNITQIFSNVPSLKFMEVDKNLFRCSILARHFRFLNKKGAKIGSGNQFTLQNINGIACTKRNFTNNQSFTTFLIEESDKSKIKC